MQERMQWVLFYLVLTILVLAQCLERRPVRQYRLLKRHRLAQRNLQVRNLQVRNLQARNRLRAKNRASLAIAKMTATILTG